MEILIIEKAMV